MRAEMVQRSDSKMPRSKRMKISSKRQLTIPAEFYEDAGFLNEAIVEYDDIGRRLIVKPVSEYEGVDFSEEILTDLVNRGLSGQELLKEFSRIKSQLPVALKTMFDEKTEETKKMPVMTSDISLNEYLDRFPDKDKK
ncbi:hypothetical protein J9303_14825 [Bacillaceae bacterium Marseille-Q3522]|nr:hypothetical protein [Bacillaceae bacterium Marseille-Q3522]